MVMHSGKYKSFNVKENTPAAFYSQLDSEFNFDFDPCPANPQFNGLMVPWVGNVYVNPPYGKAIRGWLEKALSEIECDNAKVCVFLLPAYCDVKWFHEIVLEKAQEIRFIKSRLKFGSHNCVAPFASMLVIFRKGERTL